MLIAFRFTPFLSYFDCAIFALSFNKNFIYFIFQSDAIILLF